jgi:hypothetical protein
MSHGRRRVIRLFASGEPWLNTAAGDGAGDVVATNSTPETCSDVVDGCTAEAPGQAGNERQGAGVTDKEEFTIGIDAVRWTLIAEFQERRRD